MRFPLAPKLRRGEQIPLDRKNGIARGVHLVKCQEPKHTNLSRIRSSIRLRTKLESNNTRKRRRRRYRECSNKKQYKKEIIGDYLYSLIQGSNVEMNKTKQKEGPDVNYLHYYRLLRYIVGLSSRRTKTTTKRVEQINGIYVYRAGGGGTVRTHVYVRTYFGP